MAEIARITAVVTANTTQFTRGMKAADAQTRATAASMRGASNSAMTTANSMNRVGASSKVAAAGLKAAKVGLAAIAVTAFIGTRELMDQSRVAAQTAAAIKSTGGAARVTATHISDMASALQAQTGLADDAIQGAQNLLLTFTKISNAGPDKIFDRATQATLDLSVAFGKDLSSTAIMVGKALNDPIKGITALGRAGVQFTKAQKETIKGLAESGRVGEAQKLILRELEMQIGGSAKAFGKSLPGQVQRAQRSFESLSESVAKAVIPAFLAAAPPLMDLMKAATPLFTTIGKAIASVVSPLASVLSALVQSKVAVVALTAAFGTFIAFGIASKVTKMAVAFRGLATATAAAGAANAAMGATGAAAGGAAGKVGLLARALPLVMNPLGALTVGVGVGIAALFAFRNEMSAGERIMQGLSQRTLEFRTQVTQANAAITGQRALTNAVTTTSDQAANATQKHTAAVQRYLQALQSGRAANESEAQFQQRLRALYVATAQAKVGMVNATTRSDEAVRKSVDGVTKLRDAGNQELATAQARLRNAQALQNPMAQAAMSAGQRAEAEYELAKATAGVNLAEARRGQRLKDVLAQQVATRNAIKQSTMTDDEKAASLNVVNREINKTRGALKDLSATPDPKKKVKVDVTDANAVIGTIKTALSNLDGKVVTVTLKALKQGFSMGGVVGFAGGGTVRGPAGTDVIPAMLTAGEVVLTERQQSLVNGGMSIRDALRKTGAGYKKGGKVDPKKAVKDAARDRRAAAVSRFTSAVGAIQGRAISEKYQGGRSGIGLVEQTRRGQEKALADKESKFTGTATNIGQGISNFTGSFKQFDKFQTDSNRAWERGWKGTIKLIDGSTFTGGLADFDKKVESGRKAIEQQYSALTVSEQALKSLNDEAAAADLAGNIQDAQKAYDLARQFGNAKEIADAQKALGKAELDQRRSDLEGKAKTERDTADAAKATALATLEESAATERQMLQDKFDDEKTLRDIAFTEARAHLQTQLDGQLQAQRDTDAMALAQLSFQQEQEQAALDRRLANLNAHFEKAKVTSVAAANAQIKALNANAGAMERSGETLAYSFSQGMKKGGPHIRSALRSIAGLVRDYLQLNSPAKKGPLSTLDHWFDALAPTLTDGIDTGSIEGSLNGMRAVKGGGGGVTINLTVNDSTLAGMSRDQADRVAREIQAAIARQVSFTI